MGCRMSLKSISLICMSTNLRRKWALTPKTKQHMFILILLAVIIVTAWIYSANYPQYRVRDIAYTYEEQNITKLKSDPNLNNNNNPLYTEQQQTIEHLKNQRNVLSSLLNEMKQMYGQQNCEMMILKHQNSTDVSANGGWCARASSPKSTSHVTDKSFATTLSKFLATKSVVSFGDGPGEYKKLLDSFNQVKSYTSYDGAPFCETVTGGVVKFLDLTAPQYGLPIFDWAISIEVAEHIPAKYEDVYVDNLVRHAREGIILSWAVPGQGGLSHVNNKAFKDVIQVMSRRGFNINITAGEQLRNSSQYRWLRKNVHVYYRNLTHSINEWDS